jgi:hypothetical protein
MSWYWYIKEESPDWFEVTNYKGESYWFKTREWAELCQEHFIRLACILDKEITYTNTGDLIYRTTDSIQYNIYAPEQSEWTCYLFGSNGEGISWVPSKGKVPNWFWRKMQYLILGNRWVKK